LTSSRPWSTTRTTDRYARPPVTTHALPLPAAPGERVLAQPLLDGLFFASVLTVTFHKLQWELAGSLTLSDVLTSVFLVLFVWDRFEHADARLTRTAMVALVFLLAFALVYLAGFYNLDTGQALAQWAKGMVKFVLHFGFLVTGVALLARRTTRYYWYALAAFCGGIALNALYGVVQLILAELTGANLDAALIEPITSRQTGIQIYGVVGGTEEVFRPNALTGDPNHLGIELVIPLLVLTPLYLRLERGHRLRTPLAVLLVFLLVVELATLSRSALLGLACGALVLALPYRRHLRRPSFLVPFGAAVLLVGTVVAVRWDFFLTVLSQAAGVPRTIRRRRPARRHRGRGAVGLLPHGPTCPDERQRGSSLSPLRCLRVRPGRALVEPAFRARAEQLRRVLRVRYRPAGLRPTLVLRGRARRVGDRGHRALRDVRDLALSAPRCRAADRACAHGRS